MPAFDEYIPMDRRQALARGEELPDRALGAALFADISGFTPLTEALTAELGPQLGAEELNHQLDRVFAALIETIHRFHGSVIGFSGDAVTCWFDRLPGGSPGDPSGLEAAQQRALSCALAVQAAMEPLQALYTPAGSRVELAVKVAVAAGPVRRFLVGDPAIQRLDVLAGETMAALSAAEGRAARGQVMLAIPETGNLPEGVEWEGPAPQAPVQAVAQLPLTGAAASTLAVAVRALARPADPQPWAAGAAALPEEIARPWLLPAVYTRLQRAGDRFLAELRPVTNLFLAFGGIDYDDDEDAGLLLDAFIRRVQAVAQRYEGALMDITLGDKGSYLFVSFGAPAAHDDDPARAVAAALELLSQAAALGFLDPPRLGISYGQAYAGAYGAQDRRTYGIQGDKVNLAARLMQHAAPGEILCDEETYRLARSRWAFEPLPPIRVKGKAGLIRPYRPTGESALARGPEPSLLVGRQAELARLEAALEGLSTGAGRMLIIQGEAGLGKSRLVAELVRRLRERGLTGLLGAGQSIEQGTPYRAWRSIFSSYFDIDDVVDLAERRQRVQSVVGEIAPKLAGRLPLLNDVLHLELPDTPLTAALDPALRRESLAGLLVALLQAWVKERPLVLVLEDAHWLDSLSWDLTLKAARALLSAGLPLLLALVARPLDEQHPQLEALRSLAGSETLALSGLEAPDLAALATERLGLPPGGLSEAAAALVTERAGGNPFFAEELVLNLRDAGLLIVEERSGAPQGRLSVQFEQQKSFLPDSLQGLVLARIDRLPFERQFTLKISAVIGQTFSYPPLQATIERLAPTAAAQLPAHLQELARRDFTLLKSPEPELTYVFKHIITQEVAYGMLLSDQRKAIHHTVAEWYESLLCLEEENIPGTGLEGPQVDPAVLLPLLVHHYHHAEEYTRERSYARQAGELAAQRFALAEAVTYLSRALVLTPEADQAERYDLRLLRAKMYDLLGERDAQAADIAALQDLAAALGDDRRLSEAFFRLAALKRVRGDYPASEAASRRALALAQAQGADDLETEGLIDLGRTLWKTSNYAEARALLEGALALCQAHRWLDKEASARINLGIIADLTGDRAGAQAQAEAALALFEQLKDPHGEGSAFNILGIVAWRRGDLASAQAYFERYVQIAREIGSPSDELFPLSNLAMVASARGRHAQALEFARQGLVLARQTGEPYAESRVLGLLGTASNSLGRHQEALDYFLQALDLARASSDRQDEAHKLNSLGHTSLMLGDQEAARAFCAEALEKALEIGDRDAEKDAASGLCLFYHYAGDQAEAARYGERALAIAQEISDAATQAAILTRLGHVRLALGEQEAAAQAYQEALARFLAAGQEDQSYEARAGLARLALEQGDPARALAEAEALLAGQEPEKWESCDEPARLYLAASLALQAAGDPRFRPILEAGGGLLAARAAALDPAARQRYLQDVPPNRELRELGEASTPS